MNRLLVGAFLLLPFAVIQGQDGASRATSRPMPNALDGREYKVGWSPDQASLSEMRMSRFSLRPVLFGAVIGTAVGAVIGHEIGRSRSCPTSPGYACDQPAFGTAGGAAIGMVLGATIGAIIGMRHGADSQSELIPLVSSRGSNAGFRYSRRF